MKCVILWNLHFQLKFALFDDFGHFIQENKKTEHFSIFSTQKCFSWKWDRILKKSLFRVKSKNTLFGMDSELTPVELVHK